MMKVKTETEVRFKRSCSYWLSPCCWCCERQRNKNLWDYFKYGELYSNKGWCGNWFNNNNHKTIMYFHLIRPVFCFLCWYIFILNILVIFPPREFLRLGNPLNCGAWDKKLLKQYRVHKPSSLSYDAEMRSKTITTFIQVLKTWWSLCRGVSEETLFLVSFIRSVCWSRSFRTPHGWHWGAALSSAITTGAISKNISSVLGFTYWYYSTSK